MKVDISFPQIYCGGCFIKLSERFSISATKLPDAACAILLSDPTYHPPSCEMMEMKEIMEGERILIEHHLEDFFRQEMERSSDEPLMVELLEALREYTLRGGKRIRSILAIMGYKAVGGDDLDRARKASISLELIQSMLLIHDDIMDRSDERRGGPSFHRIFQGLHERRGYLGSAERFGYNMAVIGGDLAESLGEKVLAASGFPPERVVEAVRVQSDMIRDTGFGQVFDIHSEVRPSWSEDMVEKVQKYKTARYTLEGPLHIGAVLHGAEEGQLRALSGYAIPVGIAFQIVDDILGFFGDPKRGGKEDLADIKEGKRTLLITKAMELAGGEDRRLLMETLGSDHITVEEAERVRGIIRDCGSERYSRMRASELTVKGITALEGADLEDDVVEFLKDLAGYLLDRA